eukprot:scaffold9250_cov105-Isochrysis_galbana.AAC.5
MSKSASNANHAGRVRYHLPMQQCPLDQSIQRTTSERERGEGSHTAQRHASQSKYENFKDISET